jgi:hypothetical protein
VTRTDFISRWAERAEELGRLGASVDGRRIISEFLAELECLFRGEESDSLTLAQAAQYSGYSADHIARSIRQGVIKNAGHHGRPRVRRGDLPRKPAVLRNELPEPILAAENKRQIALSVVTSTHERHDG